MWGDEFGMCDGRFGIRWMVNIAQPRDRGRRWLGRRRSFLGPLWSRAAAAWHREPVDPGLAVTIAVGAVLVAPGLPLSCGRMRRNGWYGFRPRPPFATTAPSSSPSWRPCHCRSSLGWSSASS